MWNNVGENIPPCGTDKRWVGQINDSLVWTKYYIWCQTLAVHSSSRFLAVKQTWFVGAVKYFCQPSSGLSTSVSHLYWFGHSFKTSTIGHC